MAGANGAFAPVKYAQVDHAPPAEIGEAEAGPSELPSDPKFELP